jgi:CDP-glycerol glycerophosphotransferase (TagB/SpsB family)
LHVVGDNIPKIIIKNILIKDYDFSISAVAKFKYSENYKPKMEIVFSNGIEDRRLPFIISGYNRDERSNLVSIHLEWNYNLDYLFWNQYYIEDIEISFRLIYGEKFIENFEVIKEVDFETQKSFYTPKIENSTLVLKAKKEELKIKNHAKKKYAKLEKLNSFFLLFISILAFPFFLIDGFLAHKSLTEKSPDFFRSNVTFKSILYHINWRTFKLSGHMYSLRVFKIWIMKVLYKLTKYRKIKNNRIVLMSERRDDLTGNFEYVYDILKEDNDLEIIQFFRNKPIKNFTIKEMIRYSNLIATSKVILLDDFYPIIHNFILKKDTKLIQLWHAVGAFKTFGFSRMGKIGGTPQKSPNHRNYNYAIVSSNEIKDFYAEGFGLSNEKILATGIPRTDVLFNEEYKNLIKEKLYNEFPSIKEKKVILFCPTFRGMGKNDAFYPMVKFNPEKFVDSLTNSDEYILIIKHHPFVKEKIKISKSYKNKILDLSEYSEINDLLFITNILITDYSSVIFESSILDIPMLFYSYDLEEYIRDRDFYYDFRAFVPGKIISSFEELIEAINNQDFHSYKVSTFKNRFFNDFDGRSSERVVELINSIIHDNK